MGQPSFPRSGAFAGEAFEGLRRRWHPPRRLLAPRLVTPTLVTRTPSVADAWLEGLEEPISPDAFASSYVPTRRARLREARGQVPRFRKTSRQDGFRWIPAKGSTFHTPKVPSIVGRSPWWIEGHLLAEALRTNSTRGGWAIVHRLFPACGYLTGAFSTPADWIRFDGRTRQGLVSW